MAGFYEFKQLKGMAKAQTLRAVKSAFIHGDANTIANVQRARGLQPDTSERGYLAHPYYRAPYVLMGNWQ